MFLERLFTRGRETTSSVMEVLTHPLWDLLWKFDYSVFLLWEISESISTMMVSYTLWLPVVKLMLEYFVSTVDDGTGVINCLCWKSKLLKEEEDPNKCGSKSAFKSLMCGELCLTQMFIRCSLILWCFYVKQGLNTVMQTTEGSIRWPSSGNCERPSRGAAAWTSESWSGFEDRWRLRGSRGR